jgi:hypothetical protein
MSASIGRRWGDGRRPGRRSRQQAASSTPTQVNVGLPRSSPSTSAGETSTRGEDDGHIRLEQKAASPRSSTRPNRLRFRSEFRHDATMARLVGNGHEPARLQQKNSVVSAQQIEFFREQQDQGE